MNAISINEACALRVLWYGSFATFGFSQSRNLRFLHQTLCREARDSHYRARNTPRITKPFRPKTSRWSLLRPAKNSLTLVFCAHASPRPAILILMPPRLCSTHLCFLFSRNYESTPIGLCSGRVLYLYSGRPAAGIYQEHIAKRSANDARKNGFLRRILPRYGKTSRYYSKICL